MNPNCNQSEQTESARADSVQRLVTRRRELKDSTPDIIWCTPQQIAEVRLQAAINRQMENNNRILARRHPQAPEPRDLKRKAMQTIKPTKRRKKRVTRQADPGPLAGEIQLKVWLALMAEKLNTSPKMIFRKKQLGEFTNFTFRRANARLIYVSEI